MFYKKRKIIEDNTLIFKGRKYSVAINHKRGIIFPKYFKIKIYEIIPNKKPKKIISKCIGISSEKINDARYGYYYILGKLMYAEDYEFNFFIKKLITDCLIEKYNSNIFEKRMVERTLR